MKANELMIGDLVRVNKDVSVKKGTIVKVRGIDGDRHFQELTGSTTCVAIDDPDEMTAGVWLNYLDPIPITEDILIRSGFKYDGTNAFVLEQKANKREGKKHFWIKVVPPQPDNDDWWSPDQTGFEVNNDICDMLIEGIPNVYVHQFQHVLQLAGINFYDIIKLK